MGSKKKREAREKITGIKEVPLSAAKETVANVLLNVAKGKMTQEDAKKVVSKIGQEVKADDEPISKKKKGDIRDPKVIAAEVKELLEELAGSTVVDDKKRIRRLLRARGHYGGLGKMKPAVEKKKDEKHEE